MRWLKIILCVLLGLSHLLLESGAFIRWVNDFKTVKINPFKSPWYTWPYPDGISLYHWVQMNAVEFMICTTYFCLAKVAVQYSFQLFRVALIFFFYHAIDWAMLWWDYKTSVWFYYLLNGTIIIAIVSMFIPEKKQAIIKSLN